MKARIELNLFSGFPNPRWTLPAAQTKALFDTLRGLPAESPGYIRSPPYDEPLGRPRSGYRGFTLTFENGGERVFEVFEDHVLDVETVRVRRDPGKSIEQRIYASIPRPMIDEVLEGMSLEQIAFSGSERPIKGVTQRRLSLRCRTGTVYDGNTGDFKTFRTVNNCYNYATGVLNKVIDKQAIPGTPNVRRPLNMDKLRRAVESDQLQPLGLELPNDCPPAGCHYVAVLLRTKPGGTSRDFHCLRLDRTGRWSHKDGSGQVRDVDDVGNPIVDLATAELKWDPELAGFYLFNEDHRHLIK